uniref:Uncharacterized protein n=1 Tax=Cruciviridae sp. TaxID=1955495 RepID=A0A1S6LVP8_9VIRU|nr:hypothetical protein [Cruciviridae sp.]
MWRRMAPAGSPSTTIRMRRGENLGSPHYHSFHKSGNEL